MKSSLKLLKKTKSQAIVFSSFLISLIFPFTAIAQSSQFKKNSRNLGTFKGLGAYEPIVADQGSGPQTAGSAIAQFLSNIVGFLTILAGVYFLIYFILAAIKWISASGKPDKIEEAQKTMTNGVIGLIIVAASYAIIFIISTVLGINILNLGEVLLKIGAKQP